MASEPGDEVVGCIVRQTAIWMCLKVVKHGKDNKNVKATKDSQMSLGHMYLQLKRFVINQHALSSVLPGEEGPNSHPVFSPVATFQPYRVACLVCLFHAAKV